MGVRYNFPPNFFYKLKVAEIVNIFVGKKKIFHEEFDFFNKFFLYKIIFLASTPFFRSIIFIDRFFIWNKDIYSFYKFADSEWKTVSPEGPSCPNRYLLFLYFPCCR